MWEKSELRDVITSWGVQVDFQLYVTNITVPLDYECRVSILFEMEIF
jgi:hypothetical protein